MKYALLFVLVLLAAMNCFAQYSNPAKIVATDHNLSHSTGGGVKADTFDQICYFCHVPHQKLENTNTTIVTIGPSGIAPLWNKYLSTTTYNVYQSATLPVVPTNLTLANSAAGFNAAVESNLCLSCHDGTVGVNVLFKGDRSVANFPSVNGSGNGVPYLISTASADVVIGTDSTYGFQQEHPVNFDYSAALAANPAGLAGYTTVGTRNFVQTSAGHKLPLYGLTMQCGSCHDVHSNGVSRPFLRETTTQSTLCLACHSGTGS